MQYRNELCSHFQSPEVLKMQLHNAQTIMAIGRLKLRQYLSTLRRFIPGDSTHELHQAIDGIEEVIHTNIRTELV